MTRRFFLQTGVPFSSIYPANSCTHPHDAGRTADGKESEGKHTQRNQVTKLLPACSSNPVSTICTPPVPALSSTCTSAPPLPGSETEQQQGSPQHEIPVHILEGVHRVSTRVNAMGVTGRSNSIQMAYQIIQLRGAFSHVRLCVCAQAYSTLHFAFGALAHVSCKVNSCCRDERPWRLLEVYFLQCRLEEKFSQVLVRGPDLGPFGRPIQEVPRYRRRQPVL